MSVGSAPSLEQLATGEKWPGRYDWLLVTRSGREVQFGYLLVSKNVRYARFAPRRSPLERFIFHFAGFERINDRSTNVRFGEGAV